MTRSVVPLLVSALAITFAPNSAIAQTNTEKPAPAANKINQQNISIELRDAPIRKALERLFDAVKADFVIEGTIKSGTVTTRLKDKPFETVLKVILESSSTPLQYEREGDVYIISLKPLPKPAPEPVKITNVDENPAGEQAEDGIVAGNPVEPVYYEPAYWTLPTPGGWQVGPGGFSGGQGFPQFATGFSPVGFGAPGFYSGYGMNTVFVNPRLSWGGYGGYGGFLRFP